MTILRLAARWLSLCALLLAAACSEQPAAPEVKGSPALWRVEGNGLDGWLFGTIHILPGNVRWQTGNIRKAISSADRLILETADIQDRRRTMALFEQMGRSPGLPPLESRLPAGDRGIFERIVAQSGTNGQILSGYESWAAAMLLSAATQQALHINPDDGVEAVLVAAFGDARKPVAGLETAARQFHAFDTLPEAAQRRLLARTVEEAGTLEAIYDRILHAWLKGDLAALTTAEQDAAPPDPEVEQAVLTTRNREWAVAIQRLDGRPFIAVGTGHLTGQDNLIQLLQAKGYRVTRVQ